MKLNTLEKIRDCLANEAPEIHVENSIAHRAQVGLERMLNITAGKSVDWPKHFRL